MDHTLINNIAICIIGAWLLALVSQLFKQPLVLAYLVAGYALGPMGWGIIHKQSIETISEIGLILLLFMIGLEIDLKKILSAGKMITITAAAQILGCFCLGWLFFKSVASWLGIQGLEVLYLAVAAAMSSTVIIVKILYDKRELDTSAGRLTLGILVLQDLFAILFLALQPNLTNPSLAPLVLSLVKVALLMAVAFLVSKYVLPPVFKTVARLPELVLVGALAWCFIVAGLASMLDLSREMGALIAGVAISTFPYTLDVTAKVTSLRDFFVTLFFVGLGMAIPAPSLSVLGWAVVISIFVILSRFLTVLPIMESLRQGHRNGVLVSLNLGQISEFSLVILSLGLSAGHITTATTGCMSYAFVILAVLSSYAIIKSEWLTPRLVTAMTRLGFRDLDAGEQLGIDHSHPADIFILGFFRSASSLLEEMRRKKPAMLERLVVLDFNPQVHAELKTRGIACIYGDISQRDTLLHAGISNARLIICTLPNMVLKGVDNLHLLNQLRSLNPEARIIVPADALAEVPAFYEAGASYVTASRLLEARDLLDTILAAEAGLLGQKRSLSDAELAQRQEVMP